MTNPLQIGAKLNTHSHLEQSLQRDIDHIRGKIAAMAGLSERALTASIEALTGRSRQAAYAVILRDQYIDELETEVDRLCLEFIARQQPVAGHLRFVFAAIQINRELERIGDYAESIARSVLQVRSLEPQAPYGQFVALKDLSVAMLRDALASFLRSDAELASRTIEIEEQANTVRDQIDAEVKRMNQAGELPTAAVAPLMNIARRLERATDQTKNLCEEVLYMCTGEFIKHKGADEFHILFLDQDNTCLSQLAEGLGQSLKLPRLVFGSAGIKAGPLDSRVPPFLREKGLDAAPQAPKSLAQVPNWDHAQVIVALGAPVRDAIPPHTGKTIIFTWAIANPTGHAGDLDQSRAVFEAAWHELQVHLKELVDAILQQPHPEIKA